jgi:hypothetical protein
VILRCTGRLLDLIGVRSRDLAAADPSANDWYGHLLWIDRRKCLLFTHAGTMLSIFVPDVRKADVQPLATVLVSQIATALAAEGLPLTTLGLLDPGAVRLAATVSRSILGCMRNDASMLEHAVAEHGGLHRCDIAALNHDLRRTLHLPRGREPVFPLDEVRRLAVDRDA